jgi:hypothetical protein
MKRYTNILYAAMALFMVLWLPSCVDDGLGFYDGPNDGEASLSLDMTFSPFSSGNLDTRANIENGNGKVLNILDDMYILVYDTDGNIVDLGDNTYIKEVDLETYKPVDSDTDRKDEDASNGATAEKKTLTVKNIPLRLPFGRYYIVAVANLKQETYSALHALDADGKPMNCKTLEGLRRIKVKWDNSSVRNNGEMMGYFTDSELSNVANDVPAANRMFGSVAVNRGGMKLHAWLRRCASKVTISFDGSKLRDNVSVYIKEAKIYDIPYDCTLGSGQPQGTNESEKSYNHRVEKDGETADGFYHGNPQVISYLPNNGNDATTEITDEKDVIAQRWPRISKGRTEIRDNVEDKDEAYAAATPIDFHAETADALYFYENMQDNPDNKTKLSHADLENGGVAGKTEVKDGIKYGTYIEVEGFYTSNAYGNSTHGKIKYRFMLGKNVTDNFEAERNYHYKLTLCPRGNGNDADWHIDFEEPEGFHVPNPWYVSYLYNHDAMLPFSYVAPEGWTVTGLRAEIIKNPWYPTKAEIEKLSDPNLEIKPTTPFGDETNSTAYNEPKNQKDYNGFLSLRVTDDVIITDKKAGLSWPGYNKTGSSSINEKYYYGGRYYDESSKTWKNDADYEYKIDRSQRIYLENGVKKTYDGEEGTSQALKAREDFSYKKEGNTWSFDIPLFTRAKVLVKQTGYSGNNPFVGYQRIARVRLYVTLEKGGEKKEESTDVNVVQVRRVVNPKGVYRRAGNNEPFKVTLMWLDGDDSDEFTPVASKGPWRAEIIGDANFITLDGKQTVSGSTDAPISFTIRFNRMNNDKNDKTVRNAVVRIQYHNYTCTHLIFVRQGYEPQEIVPSQHCRDKTTYPDYNANPVKWRTRNMIHGEKEAEDPRDEGSLFKFGNATQPIDAYSNVYRIDGKEVYRNLQYSEFTNKGIYDLRLVDKDGNLLSKSVSWGDVDFKDGSNFAGSIPNAATMRAYEQLYLSLNVQFGYGVLYADGATKTQEKIDDAYGYYRRDTPSGDSSKGMRGMFAYYWDGQLTGGGYNGRNIFFPIGRSGYGHRKDGREGSGSSPGNGILRYACSRGIPYNVFAADAPLFVSIYRRPGAIYWSKTVEEALEWNGEGKDAKQSYGLDINYFSFDVNAITNVNVSGGKDACFVRCVGD